MAMMTSMLADRIVDSRGSMSGRPLYHHDWFRSIERVGAVTRGALCSTSRSYRSPPAPAHALLVVGGSSPTDEMMGACSRRRAGVMAMELSAEVFDQITRALGAAAPAAEPTTQPAD